MRTWFPLEINIQYCHFSRIILEKAFIINVTSFLRKVNSEKIFSCGTALLLTQLFWDVLSLFARHHRNVHDTHMTTECLLCLQPQKCLPEGHGLTLHGSQGHVAAVYHMLALHSSPSISRPAAVSILTNLLLFLLATVWLALLITVDLSKSLSELFQPPLIFALLVGWLV